MRLSKVTSIKYKNKEILSSESKKIQHAGIFTGETPRRFHRLTHDRNKIWYYTYVREQY